ncbi:MAG TPA: DUF411 domain-containing protein [Actinomycetota bacterium]|nr:DUF411 domain-containing protein [Actinomycetota bacterium]
MRPIHGLAAAATAALVLAAGCKDTAPVTRVEGEPAGGTKATITIYASPTCGCCHEYIPYLQDHGYVVQEVATDDVNSVKLDLRVPESDWSCHTAVVDGYVIEGHVPIEAIDKLLAERPSIDGIALPGMPPGSPGMDGAKEGPFVVVSFSDGVTEEFLTI